MITKSESLMKNSIKISLYAVLFSMCVFVSTTDGYSQEQETSEEVDLTPKFGIKATDSAVDGRGFDANGAGGAARCWVGY